MHDDLRRRALESGKTVSNKAKSKQSSRASSRANSGANSRHTSRVQSRDASDDEEIAGGNLSDDTNQSINSIDALLESDDFNEQTTDVLKQELADCITDLEERKGSSNKSREDSLTTYVRYLTAHHLADVLYGKVPGILAALGRCIKAETSERETLLALRALALTAISYSDDTLYETVSSLLKRAISDSQSLPTKAAAIHSIGICISFGGADEDEVTNVMTFLLEIASSDGSFIDADDNAEVVAAALQAYGFLATQVADLEDESEDAIAVFLDQLDADDVKVQIAAGENIALLYEKSYTARSDDDTTSDIDDEEEAADNDDADHSTEDEDEDAHLVKSYNAYHNTHEVAEKVIALASLSTRSMNRRDKKNLHAAFHSIATTVQNPRSPLQTNNASKMVIRIHREGEMRVDRWWKLMRLNAIRRLLGGGFVNHYFEGNKQVLDALPMIMRDTGAGGGGMRSPRRGLLSKATKGRYRDSRRFVSGAEAGDG